VKTHHGGKVLCYLIENGTNGAAFLPCLIEAVLAEIYQLEGDKFGSCTLLQKQCLKLFISKISWQLLPDDAPVLHLVRLNEEKYQYTKKYMHEDKIKPMIVARLSAFCRSLAMRRLVVEDSITSLRPKYSQQ